MINRIFLGIRQETDNEILYYVDPVVVTLLVPNDTHDSDTQMIMHATRTITQDTRTTTNILDFHDTRTITIKKKPAHKRF